jgi:hypothetical protein
MNWSLWNNGAWDFAADTRGYTEGAVVGFVSLQWTIALVYRNTARMGNYEDALASAEATGTLPDIVEDRAAVAVDVNGLSGAHRQYLADGGIGFLVQP